jgi:hypothetical protein
VAPSDNTSAYSNKSYIVANISASDTNLKNITIYLYNSTGLYNFTTRTTSPLFVNWTELPDEKYSFNATAFDNAGNMKSTETRIIVIDVSSPAISFVSPTPDASSYLSRTYIGVNVSAIDTNQNNITIRLFNASSNSLIKAVNVSSNQSFYNFTGLKNGRYAINATAYDKFGHMNKTETRNITLDTINPTVQFVTPTTGNSSILATNSIISNVTAVDVNLKNVTTRLYTSAGSLINSSITNYNNFSGLADGNYKLNATAYDNAGNMNRTETRSITIEAANPAIQFVYQTHSSGAYLSESSIAINVSVTDGNFANLSVYLYNLTGNAIEYNFTTAASLFVNYTGLADGIYYFNATAYDTFGHSNSTETRNVTINTAYPTLIIVSPSAQEYNTSAIMVNLSASGTGIDTIWFFNGTGNETYLEPVIRTFDDGINTLYAWANDTFGHVTAKNITFTIDTVAPIVTPNSPNNGSVFNISSIMFNFTAVDSISAIMNCSLYFDYNLNQTNDSTMNDTLISMLVSDIPDGDHTWYVRCSDSVNNLNSTETRTFTVTTS